jgi:chorismate mutase
VSPTPKNKALYPWLPADKNPLVIAGPCSAESEEQVFDTAKKLSETKLVWAMRAGLWKPRSRPYTFEGHGELAAPWLVNATKKFGLHSITEVASAAHVEICLKHGISLVWIGARTTVNPFLVAEIAQSLKGVDIPVWIKNPMHPDLDLWIGAIERMQQNGLTKIGAIHRGFKTGAGSRYRNEPMWEIPLELKRRMPQIPILNDPSHIGGAKNLISGISQNAVDLDFDGLIIESHNNPEVALSDKEQQITPAELVNVIKNLQLPVPISDDVSNLQELEKFRLLIDELDEKIIQLIGKRMDISTQIGELKKQNRITIFQLERWKDIFESRTEWGKHLNLNDEFISAFLIALHRESIQKQEKVINRNQDSDKENL